MNVFLVLLGLDAIVAVIHFFGIMKARIMSERGTNVVTRFVRGGLGNMAMNRMSLLAIGCSVLFMLIGFFSIGFFGIFCATPTLATLFYTFFRQFKNNKDEQRIKDARYMTKVGLDATAQVGTIAGEAIGTYVGGPAGGQIGRVVGSAAGSIASQASSNMTDVSSANVNMAPIVGAVTPPKALPNWSDTDELIVCARRSGIRVDGRSMEDIVNDILANAAPATLQLIPADMPPKEKALAVLKGYIG